MGDPALTPRGKMVREDHGFPVDAATVPLDRPPLPVCRMRGCNGIGGDKFGFCADHRRRLPEDIRFCPGVVVPLGDEGATQTLCALCRRPVWPLRRLDDDRGGQTWAIDCQSDIEGRVWVVDGGFQVVTVDRLRDALLDDGVPLFRTHPSICPFRNHFDDR